MSKKAINPKSSKLVKGLVWNIGGTIVSKALVMIAGIITARILGADKNGEFGMISSTVGMFSIFAALGLGTTATRFVAEFKTKEKERCGNIIALILGFALAFSIIFSIILVSSSDYLATNTLNNSGLSDGLRLSAIMLIFTTLNTIQNSILSGFEDFKSIAWLTVIQGLVSFPIYLISAIAWDVNGLVVGYGLVGLISFVIARLKIKQLCKTNNISISYKTCLSEKRILISFALAALLMNVVVIPITWIGNTIITNTANGYYELGIFNAANQWRMAITLLPTAIGNVILPYIIANDDEKMEDINIMFSWLIVTFISSGVILFSTLISWFYGKTYNQQELNQSIIIICMICTLLSFKEGIARNLIKYSYMWFGFFDNLLWGACFIITIYALRSFGSVGIAIAYLTSYLIATVVFIPFYIKKNIVNKKYFLDKKVLLLWLIISADALVALFINNIFVKVLLFVVKVIILYSVSNSFFDIKAVAKRLIRKKTENKECSSAF